MWALVWAIYVIANGSSGVYANSTNQLTGFTSEHHCEEAGQRVLKLSRGNQRSNVIYTCVKVN